MKLKLREGAKVTECDPTRHLLDENFIASVIWECLKNNDPEGVVEAIEVHLRVKNRNMSDIARRNDLPRTTMNHAFKGKNPTVKTLCKMVNCCV